MLQTLPLGGDSQSFSKLLTRQTPHDQNGLLGPSSAWLIHQDHDFSQEKALSHALELFESGDVNGDGWLTCEEIVQTMLKGRERFPQLEVEPASPNLQTSVIILSVIICLHRLKACAPVAESMMMIIACC